MVDATKVSTMPLALLVGSYRHDVVDDAWFAVVLLSAVVNAVLFSTMIPTEQLRRAHGVTAAAVTAGRAPWLRSVLVVPTDYACCACPSCCWACSVVLRRLLLYLGGHDGVPPLAAR